MQNPIVTIQRLVEAKRPVDLVLQLLIDRDPGIDVALRVRGLQVGTDVAGHELVAPPAAVASRPMQ